MSDMASHQQQRNRPYYIHELTHTVLEKISVILDRNEKWKELGSDHLQWSLTKILGFEGRPNPTYAVLWEWAQQNATVLDLFTKLSKMKQFYAMTFLQDYVPSSYHYLMIEGGQPPAVDVSPKHSREELRYNSTLHDLDEKPTLPKPPLPAYRVDPGRSKRYPEQGTAFGSAFGEKLGCCADYRSELSPKEPPHSYNLNHPTKSSPLQSKMSDFRRNNPPITLPTDLPKPPLPSKVISKPTGTAESLEDNTRIPPSESDISQGRMSNRPSQPGSNRQPTEQSPPRSREQNAYSYIGDSNLPHTPFKDVELATDRFSERKVLGKGGFGVVYEGYWQNTKVAIKRIMKKDNPGLTQFEDAKLHQSYVELKTLNKYRHDNILPLYGYSMSENQLCLIYQYMVNGSLEDRLRRKNGTPPLTWKQRLVIACGSARGIQYLHNCDNKIIHGDIKSANILLDNHMAPKIGDFGLAREGPKSQSTHTVVSAVHGTQPYLPVDYIRDRQLSTKVDTYSFGIVLFELATGLRAYNESSAKYKLLRDLIMESDPETYESMRDQKAGEEMKDAFMSFITIGKQCAAVRKKERHEMVKVLELLEKVEEQLEQKERANTRNDGLPFMSSLSLTDYSPQDVSASTVSDNNYGDESFQTNASSSELNTSSSNNMLAVDVAPNFPIVTELEPKDTSRLD